MQKKFLSNLILIVVLNLLVKPFYILGIDAEVQNRVGEAAYGNYFSLLNFSFILNILLDLGVTNFNTKNIAQHPKQLVNHFSKILGLRFMLFFLYVFVSLVLGMFIGYSIEEYELLIWLLFNQFLVAIILFARSNFGGLLLFKTDALISVLDRTLLILICSVLLWTNVFGGEMKIEWFVYAQTVAYGVSALIATIMLFVKTGKVNLKLKRAFSISILKQSFPYALLIFLMFMYTRIDAVMLERMLPDGDTQAGLYAQGFRLLDAVNTFALLFAGLLLPIFARLLKERGDIHTITQLAFRILLGVSLIVGVVCFLYQDVIIDLRYPNSPVESAITFGLLILSFVPISVSYVFGTLLTANGSLGMLNKVAAGGVVLNIILNFILIQNYGVVGAAVATLITQSLVVFVQVLVAHDIFKFKFGTFFYSRFVILVGAMLLSNYVLNNYLNIGEYIRILTLLFLGIGFGFGLKIFSIYDLKNILPKAGSTDLDG